MPSPDLPSGVANARVPRSLYAPSGRAAGPTRARMTPEEFCAAGVHLNAGRRRGWRKRLALLLNTPETTIAAWATRSVGNARPIPGVTAVAVRLMVELADREMVARGDLAAATQAVLDRVLALVRPPIRLDPVRHDLPLPAVAASARLTKAERTGDLTAAGTPAQEASIGFP